MMETSQCSYASGFVLAREAVNGKIFAKMCKIWFDGMAGRNMLLSR